MRAARCLNLCPCSAPTLPTAHTSSHMTLSTCEPSQQPATASSSPTVSAKRRGPAATPPGSGRGVDFRRCARHRLQIRRCLTRRTWRRSSPRVLRPNGGSAAAARRVLASRRFSVVGSPARPQGRAPTTVRGRKGWYRAGLVGIDLPPCSCSSRERRNTWGAVPPCGGSPWPRYDDH